MHRKPPPGTVSHRPPFSQGFPLQTFDDESAEIIINRNVKPKVSIQVTLNDTYKHEIHNEYR